MTYAVNLADWLGKKDDWGLAILLKPVTESKEVVEVERGEHDEPLPQPEPTPQPAPTPAPAEPVIPTFVEPQTLVVRVEQQPVFAVFEAQRDAFNLGDVSRFTWLEVAGLEARGNGGCLVPEVWLEVPQRVAEPVQQSLL